MRIKNYLLKDWPLIFIITLSLLIIWPLFLPGYFSHHDDLQIMRVFEMRRCFEDLQIPCRWVPDMGYGNGFPLFNYYSAFPYYLGAVLSFLVGYIGAVKALFLIALMAGGVFMYFLGRELFGPEAGIVSGVLYMLAPYKALDVYVRGALVESLALAIIPLVFYFALRLIKENSLFNFLGLVISLAAFLTTHNIMTLFFLPLFLLWIIYLLLINEKRSLKAISFSLILGFGLSAFFLLPAFLEKDLVQADNLTRLDLDFRAHFVTVSQLFFNRDWGYGASVLGPNDTISFQVGWPHWWLIIAFVPALLFTKIKAKRIVGVLFLLVFSMSILMTHNKSGFIWEQIGILRYTQFPWRFLSLVVFAASLLGGMTVLMFSKRWQGLVAAVIVLVTVFFNWQYFRPEKFDYLATDQNKMTGQEWERQQKATVLDYLPQTAQEPYEAALLKPIIKSGKAEIMTFVNRSNFWSFPIDVKKQALVEIPVFDFPNWQVTVNGEKIKHTNNNYPGRITIDLPEGHYQVEGKLYNTQIRMFSNIITFGSILGLCLITFYAKIRRLII